MGLTALKAVLRGVDTPDMNPLVNPDRRCPECQVRDYVFRGRKTVEDEGGKAVVTKYICRPCGHEWRERVPVTEKKAG